MDPFDAAREFVAVEFPLAAVAVVAGSTARSTRTATSDIDLLLIGPDEMFGDVPSLAATYEQAGEVIEVFAYTDASFEEWAARGASQFRPVIVEMLAQGVAVRDDGSLAARRDWCRRLLHAGASPSREQLEMKRYVVTDVCDDLHDATDPLEERVLMSLLFSETAELALLSNGQWIGTGKYLPRRLRAWDDERARELADPYLAGDRERFLTAVEHELALAGGRRQAGHAR